MTPLCRQSTFVFPREKNQRETYKEPVFPWMVPRNTFNFKDKIVPAPDITPLKPRGKQTAQKKTALDVT